MENNQKHFVTFYSPGTFVSENTRREVDSWDVDNAVEMSHTILERHNAKPYGFKFSTQESDGWNPNEVESSPMYYLGGEIRTYAELVEENSPDNQILISNMRINEWNRVLVNTNSWKFTAPLEDEDVVLDYCK